MVTERAKQFMGIEDEFSKLKGCNKNIKRITRKERQKLFEEFFETDTSNIFRKFNLD